MIKASISFVILTAASPILAGSGGRLTNDQAAIAYQQCLAHAAARLSRGFLHEDSIFPQASRLCVRTRVSLQTGAANIVSAGEVLDRIDAESRSSFPERTRRVREMRQRFEGKTHRSGR